MQNGIENKKEFAYLLYIFLVIYIIVIRVVSLIR